MTSFQSSELTELPVVENSQLFAQRTVRPHRQQGPEILSSINGWATCFMHARHGPV